MTTNAYNKNPSEPKPRICDDILVSYDKALRRIAELEQKCKSLNEQYCDAMGMLRDAVKKLDPYIHENKRLHETITDLKRQLAESVPWDDFAPECRHAYTTGTCIQKIQCGKYRHEIACLRENCPPMLR